MTSNRAKFEIAYWLSVFSLSAAAIVASRGYIGDAFGIVILTSFIGLPAVLLYSTRMTTMGKNTATTVINGTAYGFDGNAAVAINTLQEQAARYRAALKEIAENGHIIGWLPASNIAKEALKEPGHGD